MAKHPGFMIAIGVGKKKPPEDAPPRYTTGGADSEPDPGDPNEAAENEPEGGGSVTIGPEDVDYSDQDLCETCANMGADGNCSKYKFPVDKTGHCEAGYEPKDGGMGDMGGEPPMPGAVAQ